MIVTPRSPGAMSPVFDARFIILLALPMALAAAASRAEPYRSAVLADNPRGYFRLGEAPGATTAVNDPGASGGAGMDGTYVNAPTLGVAGIPGADPNTAVTMSAAGSQRVTNIMDSYTYTAFSLEAWVRTSSIADQGLVVYTDASGPGVAWSNNLRIVVDGGTARFCLYVYDNGSKWIESTSAVTPGDLYHVVGTAENGGRMNLYVNGVLEAEASVQSLWNLGDRWFLGSIGGANGPFSQGYFNGTLDEVAIYPTVLSPTAIQAHYAAGMTNSAVPEIDPAGFTSMAPLVAGALGLLERRRRHDAGR